MKRLVNILLLLMLSIPTAWSGIVLTKSANLPRSGDILKRIQVTFPDTLKQPNGIIGDFSKVSVVDGTYESVIKSYGEGVLDIFERNTHFRYRISGDSLLYVGFENRHTLLKDSIVGLEMIYPIHYGATHSKDFILSGRYSSQRQLEESGTTRIIADAEGCLILSEGDTIENVLRITTVTNSRIKVTSSNIITEKEDSDSIKIRHYRIKHSWYASGYRYPLAESVSESYYRGNQHSKTTKAAYLYSMSDQAFDITADEVNEDVRRLKLQGREESENNSGNQANETIEITNVSISVNNGKVCVSYDSSYSQCELEMVLSDSQGRVYSYIDKHITEEGRNYEEIDCGRLPSGIYLLCFKYADKTDYHQFIIL